jgi:AbrB family looped-hinge helix DNA binding protein
MAHYHDIMNTRLTMDRAGRIVIPKSVREELRLELGDELEIESAEGHNSPPIARRCTTPQ